MAQTISIEWDKLPGADAKNQLIRFMEDSGFLFYTEEFIDVIFIKDTLNDPHRRITKLEKQPRLA